MKKIISILMISSMFLLSGCSSGGTESSNNGEIVFADAGWDSIKLHNAIAGTIAEEVFGYSWREAPGSSTVLHEGLLMGEIDVHMENWTDNLVSYEHDLKAGKFKELGINFDDNNQGIYVPRYVIEGDETRNINPLAPDLKYVWDLKNYSDVFKDEENPDKGRIYGAIPGWEVDKIMYNKYLNYGLDENFIYFRPGSDAALSAAMVSAYEKGLPIAAYYWDPTWMMGKYDFVLLEDEPFDKLTYTEGKTALPSVKVTIGASNKFYDNETNKEFIEFLSKYHTSSEMTSKGLAHMQETGDSYKDTAIWFLKENDNLIDEWLNKDQADIIRTYLNK